MFEFSRRDVIGVLGGMGPMASAEFLKTVYTCCRGEVEQEFPVVMVYSDPTIPDRTSAFRAGRDDEVLEPLIAGFNRLIGMGATKLMMCCMTSHHLNPQFPSAIRERLISLPDIVFDQLEKANKRHVLICSSGTREFQLFEKHERWESLKDRIILPNEAEQHRIHHDFIYPIKKNPDTRERLPILGALLSKYKTDSFIVGCSEIHLVAKQLIFSNGNQKKYSCIDPLMVLAQDIAKERL